MMYAGMILLALGAMMGDSENLIIPTIILAVGAVLTLKGQKKYADEIDDEAAGDSARP